MNNRRNKLLLSLAKNRKQSDIYSCEDLSNLIDNEHIEELNEGITDEFQQANRDDCELFEDMRFAEGADKFELFGDNTFKEILDDIDGITVSNTSLIVNNTVSSLNIEDTGYKDGNSHTQDNLEPLIQDELLSTSRPDTLLPTTARKSRSVTPVPCDYSSFGSSPINISPSNENADTLTSLNHVVDRIQELNTAIPLRPPETNISYHEPGSLSSRPQSPGQLSTSAIASAVEASSDCSTPSSVTGRKRRKFVMDTTKKKRQCKKDNWLDTKRKLLVNQGKAHLSRGGKPQQAKVLKSACRNCKFQCQTKVTEETRNRIFNIFWGLGDHTKQWQFIGKNTKRFTKRRITTDNNSNRNYSVHYFLPVINSNQETVIKVCKNMIKNTLNVSNQFIQSGIDKYNTTTGVCEIDKRGVHCNKKRVLTDAVIKGVCDHVKSFRPVESHYTRKDSNKLYLDNDLNFNKMFKMYQEWTTENHIQDKVSTLRQYRDVVNSHLNIGFFMPKKDTCDICAANINKPNTEESNIDFSNHIKNKNIARSLKMQDKNIAQCKTTEVSVATFDFQKILSTPHGETSSFYYKRKLSVFNFTIFDMGHKKGLCYMWDETTAKRGSNEVASCLYNYIAKCANTGIKDIRLWSDNCGGQNRNRSVFLMYLHAAKTFKVHICHRFLEKGHTQQEGDSVHALIERSSKRKMIYTPQEWYTCVRWCKVNGEPYEVIEVSKEDIFDFKSDTNQYTWIKNYDNEKVKWNQVREVKVDPNVPFVINYKYDLNEMQSMKIDCCRRASTRNRQTNLAPLSLKLAYNDTLPITSAKYKDLINLCDQNLIPPRYHNFYKSIKHNTIDTVGSDEED